MISYRRPQNGAAQNDRGLLCDVACRCDLRRGRKPRSKIWSRFVGNSWHRLDILEGRGGVGVLSHEHRVSEIVRTIMFVATLLSSGCMPGGGNPTPGAKAVSIGKAWVRHVKDSYDREATAVVGFTLEDSKHQPIAADGDLAVELKWQEGVMEYTAKGKAEVDASRFHKAQGKPVRDGTWYTEPWSIYLIGQQYPGPSRNGYAVTLTFTSKEGEKLAWRQWASPTR
jgi:hypothetical protein